MDKGPGFFPACAQRRAFLEGAEGGVDFGSLTPARLHSPCCPSFQALSAYIRVAVDQNTLKANLTFDALVDHLPLSVRGSAELLDRQLPPSAFRFTILRDPTEQFLSYYAHLKEAAYQSPDPLPPLRQLLTHLHRAEGAGDLSILHSLLANTQVPLIRSLTDKGGSGRMTQARELGWSGAKEDLPRIIQRLSSLNFVGLFEELPASLTLLRERLRWPPSFFPPSPGTGSRAEGLTPDERAMLEDIQWADWTLYKEARRLFRGEGTTWDRVLLGNTMWRP